MTTAGKQHAARMAYALAPPFELRAQLEVKEGATRDYAERGVKLGPGEVVVDGEDQVGVVAFVHRTDVADPDEPVANLTVEKWETVLEGRLKDRLTCKQDEEFDEPDKTRFLVTSEALQLYDQKGEERLKLKLKVRFKLPGVGADVGPIELTGEAVLVPRLVYLKLWVVPGGAPGTSEAAAFVCLAPSPARPLAGVALSLRTASTGAPSLTADSDSASTDSAGLAAWTLRYQGLRWDNVANVVLSVVCGVNGKEGTPSQATEVTVDVSRNLVDLLGAIHGDRRRPELDLDNPAFSSEGGGVFRTLVDWSFPDYLTGPAINIAYAVAAIGGYVSTAAASVEQYLGRYLCGSLASRIGTYAVKRRFGKADWDPARLAAMNGVEVNEYYIWFIPKSHHFAGLHLSGSGPDDDPRFVDPWWRQDWSRGDYLTVNGLLDKNSERIRATSSIALSAVLTILAAKVLVVVLSVGTLTALQMVRTFLASALGLGAPSLAVFTYTDAMYVVNGSYQEYRRRWRNEAVAWLRAQSPELDPVAPVRAW